MKSLKKKKNKRLKNISAGFSVIELSVILVVFSFFVVNSFLLKDATKEFSKLFNTYEKLEIIQKTLTKHVNMFGYYPCPADGTLAANDVNLGVGFGTNKLDPQISPKCGTVGNPVNFTYNTGGNAIFDMMLGVVPVRNLGLPLDFMFDEWGNRFGYGVLDHLTARTAYESTMNANTPPATVSGNTSEGIRIINENGTVTDSAAYVLISYGPNGYGAYGYNGGTRVQAPNLTSIDPTESHNHHLDDQTDVITVGAPEANNGNFDDDFDNIFYQQAIPQDDPTGNLILNDDIVVYSEQETSTFDFSGFDTPASSVSFRPNQIAGLILWLDANSCDLVFHGDGVAIIENTVACNPSQPAGKEDAAWWYERSDTYNNAVNNVGTSLPAGGIAPEHMSVGNGIGNKRSLLFNPAAPLFYDTIAILNPLSLDPTSLTAFVVGKRVDDSSIAQTLIVKSDAYGLPTPPNPSNGYAISGFGPGYDNSSIGLWINDYQLPANRVETANVATGVDYIFMVHYDGSTNEMAIENACNGEVTSIGPAKSATTLFDPFIIGTMNIDSIPTGTVDGHIGEIVMYNTVLSDIDKDRVVNYLSDKWLGTTGGAVGCGNYGLGLTIEQECTNAGGLFTVASATACTLNSECCSGQCDVGVSNTCCIPNSDTYTASLDKCVSNDDCCDPLAACSTTGLCWRAPDTY